MRSELSTEIWFTGPNKLKMTRRNRWVLCALSETDVKCLLRPHTHTHTRMHARTHTRTEEMFSQLNTYWEHGLVSMYIWNFIKNQYDPWLQIRLQRARRRHTADDIWSRLGAKIGASMQHQISLNVYSISLISKSPLTSTAFTVAQWPDTRCLSHGMCLYQIIIRPTLHFLNDIVNDVESTRKAIITRLGWSYDMTSSTRRDTVRQIKLQLWYCVLIASFKSGPPC